MASKDSKTVDLEYIIKQWANDHFIDHAPCWEQQLIKSGKTEMDIDWKRVKFIDSPAQYDPPPSDGISEIQGSQVLFQTTFTNESSQEQNFSFKTERRTKSTCSIEVQQGYTKGVEMNVKLSTPDEVLALNAGFKHEISLANTESHTVEEELMWGVDSQVKVESGHTAVAKLLIQEEEYKGTFEVKTLISGDARVVLRKLKNNNSFMRAVQWSVANIIKEAIKKPRIQSPQCFEVKTDDVVICTTKGKCRFRYGIKQSVDVKQEKITK